jgi:hypothetical protein
MTPNTDAITKLSEKQFDALLSEAITPGLVAFLVKAYQLPEELHEIAIDIFDAADERTRFLFIATFCYFLSMRKGTLVTPSATTVADNLEYLDDFLATAVRKTYSGGFYEAAKKAGCAA